MTGNLGDLKIIPLMTPRWRTVIENIVWREDPVKGFDSLVNIAGDRGGWTRAGISTPEAMRYFNFSDLGSMPEGMKNLTKSQIINYYWTTHIVQPAFSFLPEPLDDMIVDFSVTSGPDDSVKAMQASLNVEARTKRAPNTAPLKEDGILGPMTRKSLMDFLIISSLAPTINETRLHNFIKNFVYFRTHHYISVCKSRPDQVKFMAGWFNRAYSFLPSE